MIDLFASNSGLIDTWSAAHFATGFIWAVWLFPRAPLRIQLVSLLVATAAWELLEIAQGSGGFGGSETGINAIADIFFALAGFAIGRLLFRQVVENG